MHSTYFSRILAVGIPLTRALLLRIIIKLHSTFELSLLRRGLIVKPESENSSSTDSFEPCTNMKTTDANSKANNQHTHAYSRCVHSQRRDQHGWE